MRSTTDTVRADFDRIARFSDDGWDHNSHYHAFLLRHLPPRVVETLEVGCGTGTFARLLAARAERVVALDLSPEMVRLARQRSRAFPTIAYEVADVREREFSPDRFDCIATIATLHHLPLQPTLERLRDALRPGGCLLVLDLYRAEGIVDRIVAAAGLPASRVLKCHHGRGGSQPAGARQAWEEHGRGDVYPALSEVRGVCAAALPGARVRRRLLWRYSIVWRKP